VPHVRGRVDGIRDGMEGVSSGFRLPLVMDDWEQLHIHATLLTLPSIATVL